MSSRADMHTRGGEPTPGQKRVLAAVARGRNVFMYGEGGCGKSFCISLIRARARGTLAVTSTTGISAQLIGGTTVHSFLDIGTASKSAEDLARSATANVVRKLNKLRTLVIDEMSMLDADLFGKIDEYLRRVRKIDRPFGGVQLVLSGDPYQIPPYGQRRFAFQNEDVWRSADFLVVELKGSVRHSSDPAFQGLLSRLRLGSCSDADLATLNALRDTEFPPGILPTKIFSKNVDVDRINADAVSDLVRSGAPYRTYEAKSRPNKPTGWWAIGLRIPASVAMCVGAQVMVTANLPSLGVFNGSRGAVLDVSSEDFVRIRLAMDGRTVDLPRQTATNDLDPADKVSYVPLKMAFALTIHKAQGQTIDAIEIDIGGDVFQPGAAYVALSRARSLASIRVASVSAKSFFASPDVTSFLGGDGAACDGDGDGISACDGAACDGGDDAFERNPWEKFAFDDGGKKSRSTSMSVSTSTSTSMPRQMSR